MKKYIVSIKYCIARHNDKMCFLLNSRYHIMLIGDIKKLLQKMESVSTTNTLTVTIPFSTTNSVAKRLSRVGTSLIFCLGQFISTTNTEE